MIFLSKKWILIVLDLVIADPLNLRHRPIFSPRLPFPQSDRINDFVNHVLNQLDTYILSVLRKISGCRRRLSAVHDVTSVFRAEQDWLIYHI